MKTQSFTRTKSYFWLHCTLVILILTLGIIFGADAAPRKYKGHAKQERIFRERKARNLAEQDRIQFKGIKKYKRSNSWQIGRH